jgi:hypothetical protein
MAAAIVNATHPIPFVLLGPRTRSDRLGEVGARKRSLSLNHSIGADILLEHDHCKQNRNNRKNAFRIQIDSQYTGSPAWDSFFDVRTGEVYGYFEGKVLERHYRLTTLGASPVTVK